MHKGAIDFILEYEKDNTISRTRPEVIFVTVTTVKVADPKDIPMPSDWSEGPAGAEVQRPYDPEPKPFHDGHWEEEILNTYNKLGIQAGDIIAEYQGHPDGFKTEDAFFARLRLARQEHAKSIGDNRPEEEPCGPVYTHEERHKHHLFVIGFYSIHLRDWTTWKTDTVTERRYHTYEEIEIMQARARLWTECPRSIIDEYLRMHGPKHPNYDHIHDYMGVMLRHRRMRPSINYVKMKLRILGKELLDYFADRNAAAERRAQLEAGILISNTIRNMYYRKKLYNTFMNLLHVYITYEQSGYTYITHKQSGYPSPTSIITLNLAAPTCSTPKPPIPTRFSATTSRRKRSQAVRPGGDQALRPGGDQRPGGAFSYASWGQDRRRTTPTTARSTLALARSSTLARSPLALARSPTSRALARKRNNYQFDQRLALVARLDRTTARRTTSPSRASHLSSSASLRTPTPTHAPTTLRLTPMFDCQSDDDMYTHTHAHKSDDDILLALSTPRTDPDQLKPEKQNDKQMGNTQIIDSQTNKYNFTLPPGQHPSIPTGKGSYLEYQYELNRDGEHLRETGYEFDGDQPSSYSSDYGNSSSYDGDYHSANGHDDDHHDDDCYDDDYTGDHDQPSESDSVGQEEDDPG